MKPFNFCDTSNFEPLVMNEDLLKTNEYKFGEMNKYIATFHSHFGALSYCKTLKDQGITAKLMPVPRKVSSSCGACVYYEHTLPVDLEGCELDSIYFETNDAFDCVLRR